MQADAVIHDGPDVGRMRLAGDVRGLRRVMRSGDFSTALRAVQLLGDIGGPAAADALLDCLKRPSRYVLHLHLWVITPLARMREPRAVPLLLRRLREGGVENDGQNDTLFQALGLLGGPEIVRELVGRLAEPRPSKPVVDAVAALRPPEAVPALLAALWTLLPRDEIHAVQVLGAMRDPRTAPALFFLVDSKSTSPELRREAVQALTELPEESWPPPAGWLPEIMLRRALRDPDASTAAPAAELLARTDRGRDVLRGDLMDSVPGRRAEYRSPACAAVTVCAFIRERPELFGGKQDYRDVPTLIKLLGEAAVPTVRRAAAEALGAVGGLTATEALLAVLGDARVGEAAATALARLPEPPVPALLALLTDGDSEAQRRCAALALGLAGRTEAAPPLLAVLDALDAGAAPRLRAAAVDALAALRHRPAAGRLADLAADEDQPGTLRARALHALGRVGAPESLPVVLAALRDPASPVRLQAAGALGSFPGQAAAEALGTLAAKDTDRDVARAAVRTLGGLGTSAAPVLASLALALPLRTDVIGELITALARCPGPEADVGLGQLTKPGLAEDVHVAAAEALGARRAPESAAPLAALLDDDHPYGCRNVALTALAALGTEEADEHVLAHVRTTQQFTEAWRKALTTIAQRLGTPDQARS
ncbi:HEAT repeat domain-containing protein [Streptomyces kanamyceticus]|uniref:HEAT repeat domain-containing protein n=1 Tax=Streptomyces kanamyceticus TaxID=1967 RepID=A0A5J6G9C5_STRKN|nr:HEAT repeat domain-containing protein [Streptomyces kanamyceticus]QEU91212.1 HEAT repeat domain-containing protein [Streptomyces kanamyceticus]